MYQFSFEHLTVWQDTRVLVKAIYEETQRFPDSEKFGLTNQIRRSAVSISSNIAEGSSRTSKKDQAHFYTMAYSSSIELMSQLILAFDLNYLQEVGLQKYRAEIEKISSKINALKKAALKDS
jgi:four helix bundle protein